MPASDSINDLEVKLKQLLNKMFVKSKGIGIVSKSKPVMQRGLDLCKVRAVPVKNALI